ncbi:MAG: V-type ATPase subunit [Candidatus Micrarchaeota archaeon]
MDLAYAYANARVKAMTSKLLDRDAMRELLDVKSLPEFIELLEEGPYKPAFVAASTRYSGSELVKRALDDDLAVAAGKVYRIAPLKAKRMVARLLKDWEVNNVKKIIALRALGRGVSLQDLLVVGDGRLVEKLVAQQDLDGVLRSLMLTEYSGALGGALPHFRKSGDYRGLLGALDAYNCNALAAAAVEESDPQLKRFLERRISIINAVTALRLRKSGVTAGKTRPFIIPAPGQSFCEKMIVAKGLKEAAAIASERLGIPLPEEVVRHAAESGELAQVEEVFQNQLLREARKTLRRSVLSPGVLAGYMYLKHEEVHSLRMIAYATQFEVKQDIRDSILSRLN